MFLGKVNRDSNQEKNIHTFCNCLCFHGNLLIEKSFELMGYFKHGNACFSDDLTTLSRINTYSKARKYTTAMILCCSYTIPE